MEAVPAPVAKSFDVILSDGEESVFESRPFAVAQGDNSVAEAAKPCDKTNGRMNSSAPESVPRAEG